MVPLMTGIRIRENGSAYHPGDAPSSGVILSPPRPRVVFSGNSLVKFAHRRRMVRRKPFQNRVPAQENFALGHQPGAIPLLLAKIDDGVKVFCLALDLPGVRILAYGADIHVGDPRTPSGPSGCARRG